MRVLVESTPNYLNMGDLAMLQIALRRIRNLWPDAAIWAMTSDPIRLQAACPGVRPVFATARDLLLQSSGRWKTFLRTRWPAAYLWAVKDPAARPLLRDFIRIVGGMDLYVVAGAGSFTSAFEPAVLPMIRTIPLMKSWGIPCVAFSQGIGPIRRDSALWKAARQALPSLDFIGLREPRSGPLCLAELGICGDRFAVTGDDAVEAAYERRASTTAPRQWIGFALRATRYSGIAGEQERRISSAVWAVARRLGGALRSTPVSHVPEESDAGTFSRMFRWTPSGADAFTPERLIDEIGRCRIVITGAYHAAVFALAQGIPAICIANSEYYRDKFLGLQVQFGSGCRVLDPSEADFEDSLASIALEFWRGAEDYRDRLLGKAEQQIEASRGAWAALAWRVRARRRTGVLESDDDGRMAWYRYRVETMTSDLRNLAEYLHQVEAARDWHRARAETIEAWIETIETQP